MGSTLRVISTHRGLAVPTVGILLLVLGGSGLAQSPTRRPAIEFFDLERYDTDRIASEARGDGIVTLRYFGRTHHLRLEPSNIRSPRCRLTAGAVGEERTIYEPVQHCYRGRLADDPSSIVRLSVSPDGLRGCIKSSDGWVFIEPHTGPLPAGSPPESPGAHRVFCDADIDAAFQVLCMDDAVTPPSGMRDSSVPASLDSPVEPTLPSTTGAEPSSEAATLRILELAIDTDLEYVQACLQRGVTPTQEVESVLNILDGIYQAELGLQIQLAYLHHWDAEPDPYTSTDSAELLSELAHFWNVSRTGVARDAVHLFTGKDLDDSTVGRAYLSVVCNRSVAYGLSQDLAMATSLFPILVAHEVGHNLGAGHDPDGSTPRYVMYPSLGSSNLDEFSPLTTAQIQSYVDSVTCLSLAGDGTGSGTIPVLPPPTSGGGGGPVDPWLLVVLGAGLPGLIRRRQRGRP